MQPIQTAAWCSHEDLQGLDLKQKRIQASLPWEQTQGSEQKGRSPHVYTEQTTPEVTYWGSARKSTTKTTSTFSHVDICSFCLHFSFPKPTPSPTQWFLIQPALQTGTARNNGSRKTYHDVQIHLGEGGDAHHPSLYRPSPLSRHRTCNAHD